MQRPIATKFTYLLLTLIVILLSAGAIIGGIYLNNLQNQEQQPASGQSTAVDEEPGFTTEVFVDDEGEIEASARSTENIFTSSDICTPVIVFEDFSDPQAINPELAYREKGKYRVSDGNMQLIKFGDTISNGEVKLNKTPAIYANHEFTGEMQISVKVINFSSPLTLNPVLKKEQDLQTYSGVRLRLVSKNTSQGTLLFNFYQKPSGRFYAEIARFTSDNGYKVLERKDMTAMIDDSSNFDINMSMRRINGDNNELWVLPKLTVRINGSDFAQEFAQRMLDGNLLFAGVIHKANWQTTETTATIDQLEFQGCSQSRTADNTKYLLNTMESAEKFLEDEAGQ